MADEKLFAVEWDLNGSALHSVQDASGYLGTDYTQSVDHRWRGIGLVLGPKLTSIDLSAASGSATNANGQAEITVSGTEIAYIIRGTKWAKVNLATMALISNGSESALGEAATSILYVKNADGTERMVFGMANTLFRIITVFTTGATDTHVAHATDKYRIFAYGTPSSVLVGLGKAALTPENVIASVQLTGSVTPDTAAFSTRATVAGSEFTFTGFARDGNFWIVGTSDGPYYLDSDFSEFRPLIPELDLNTAHCANELETSFFGTLIPLANGLRQSHYLSGQSVGVEKWPGNRSPVLPPVTAIAVGGEKWFYTWHRNAITSASYLVAWRPAEPGDDHPNPFTPYVVGYTTSVVGYCRYIGTRGGRTLPTFMAGRDSNALYWGEGRTVARPDDTSADYESSGTWYGTEMRTRTMTDIVGWEIIGGTYNPTNYAVVSVRLDGRETIQLGGPLKEFSNDGVYRYMFPANESVKGMQVRPQIALTGSGTTNTPVVPRFRLLFKNLPTCVDGRFLPPEVVTRG